MKILTNKMNINIHDVVEAAGTNHLDSKFEPGPGGRRALYPNRSSFYEMGNNNI